MNKINKFLTIFEVFIFVVTSIYIIYFIKYKKRELILFFTVCFFDLGIELISIQFNVYQFGNFIVMINGVPLCNVLMWGLIIYSSMKTSERLVTKIIPKAMMAALLLLNFDIAIDAVAIRLGFWEWNTQSWYALWYGVPIGNFFLWFVFVFAFSLIWYFLYRYIQKEPTVRNYINPLLSLFTGYGIVVIGNLTQFFPILKRVQVGLFITAVAVAIVIVVYNRGSGGYIPSKRRDLVMMSGPFAIHLFFIFSLLFIGLHQSHPVLLFVSIFMMFISTIVHLLPYKLINQRISI